MQACLLNNQLRRSELCGFAPVCKEGWLSMVVLVQDRVSWTVVVGVAFHLDQNDTGWQIPGKIFFSGCRTPVYHARSGGHALPLLSPNSAARMVPTPT